MAASKPAMESATTVTINLLYIPRTAVPLVTKCRGTEAVLTNLESSMKPVRGTKPNQIFGTDQYRCDPRLQTDESVLLVKTGLVLACLPECLQGRSQS